MRLRRKSLPAEFKQPVTLQLQTGTHSTVCLYLCSCIPQLPFGRGLKQNHAALNTHLHASVFLFAEARVCLRAYCSSLLGENWNDNMQLLCTNKLMALVVRAGMCAPQLPVRRRLERQHAGHHAERGLLAGEGGCVVHDARHWQPFAGGRRAPLMTWCFCAVHAVLVRKGVAVCTGSTSGQCVPTVCV